MPLTDDPQQVWIRMLPNTNSERMLLEYEYRSDVFSIRSNHPSISSSRCRVHVNGAGRKEPSLTTGRLDFMYKYYTKPQPLPFFSDFTTFFELMWCIEPCTGRGPHWSVQPHTALYTRTPPAPMVRLVMVAIQGWRTQASTTSLWTCCGVLLQLRGRTPVGYSSIASRGKQRRVGRFRRFKPVSTQLQPTSFLTAVLNQKPANFDANHTSGPVRVGLLV
jgi:hypothetical protein